MENGKLFLIQKTIGQKVFLEKYCFWELMHKRWECNLYDHWECNLAIPSKVEDMYTLQPVDSNSYACVKGDMQEDVDCSIVCSGKNLETT